MTDAPAKYYSKSVATVPGCNYLHKHSGRVNTGLRKLTSRTVVIKPQTIVVIISATNVVPPMLTPRVSIKSATISDSECSSQDGEQNITTKVGTDRPKLLFRTALEII